jgi:hypothetical protein
VNYGISSDRPIGEIRDALGYALTLLRHYLAEDDD